MDNLELLIQIFKKIDDRLIDIEEDINDLVDLIRDNKIDNYNKELHKEKHWLLNV